MDSKEAVIEKIRDGFGENEYPGDDYLQGSFEGREPFEEIDPFKDLQDWQSIPAQLLDQHHVALSFFSEAGLRFFLPAYLIADVNGLLETAEPLFILVHGFSELSVEHRISDQVFLRKGGKSAFVNPRRYGGMTFYDYARYRLSIFTREEAQAIVDYMNYKRDSDPEGINAAEIEAALNTFWAERINDAASRVDIDQYVVEEDKYLDAVISAGKDNG